MNKTKWDHLLEIMSYDDLVRLRRILYNKGGLETMLLVDDVDQLLRKLQASLRT